MSMGMWVGEMKMGTWRQVLVDYVIAYRVTWCPLDLGGTYASFSPLQRIIFSMSPKACVFRSHST